MKKTNGLKVARESKNISQKELAIKMNVDIQAIKNWEKGIGTLSYDNLIDLCNYLDTKPNLILFGEQRKGLRLSRLSVAQQLKIKQIYLEMLSLDKE